MHCRLYSEYYHRYGQNRKKYNPSPEHFHDLVIEGLRLYKECLESRTIRACVYDERIYIPLNVSYTHKVGYRVFGLFDQASGL